MENALKVTKRFKRICKNYLNLYGEYGKFRVVCCTQNRLRIRRNYLNVFVEYMERIYTMRTWSRRKETLGVFSKYAKRHKTEHIPVKKMVQHEFSVDSYYLYKMGWIKPNHFTLP
jgi:hypothetical protein